MRQGNDRSLLALLTQIVQDGRMSRGVGRPVVDPAVRQRPHERVAAACEQWGDAEVVRRCGALLHAAPESTVTGDGLELAMVLGGLTDRDWLAGGKPPGHAYWARVWAARALRYVWNDEASAAVTEALGDEHWRVREMAANVVKDHEVPDTADLLVALLDDDVPRVRQAAARALAVVGEGEQADAIRALLDDPDQAVAGAALTALSTLSRRLDRPM